MQDDLLTWVFESVGHIEIPNGIDKELFKQHCMTKFLCSKPRFHFNLLEKSEGFMNGEEKVLDYCSVALDSVDHWDLTYSTWNAISKDESYKKVYAQFFKKDESPLHDEVEGLFLRTKIFS